MEGVHPPIDLNDAPRMSFIRVFHNIQQCDNLIETSPRKMITLFAYGNNIQRWLPAINDMPPNLQKIRIFCHENDSAFVNGWARRYRQRFKNISFNTIDCKELNQRLLLFGVDYLQQLREDFQPGSLEFQQSVRDYKTICHSLANYFWQEANP
ncbi:unnamed protein product [Rotaria sp. Silwood1]|nr:unnamed protein product [Rotaria sp. Silwood1]